MAKYTDLNMITEPGRLKPEVGADEVRPYDEVRGALNEQDAQVLDTLRNHLIHRLGNEAQMAKFGVVTFEPEDDKHFPHVVVAELRGERFTVAATWVLWFNQDDAMPDSGGEQPSAAKGVE